MDLTEDQQLIRDSVLKLCARFDDAYWLARDRDGEFPRDFVAAFAAGGWIRTAMPARPPSLSLTAHPSPLPKRQRKT